MNKILIIDDEVNVALLLSKFLIRNGFDVTTASSGNMGMECLKNGHFDLVLCDFRLEDTDGRQMLKSIKKQIELLISVYEKKINLDITNF